MYNKDEEKELPMKKIKNILLLLVIMIAIPTIAYAKSYTALNLEETLTREKIEHDLKDYKETNNQITIYMFRGDRCGYCQNFLKFLQENVKEYGEYFKLRSFEIWHNENNASLMSEVAEHFDKSVKGVPLIVIGEKVFQGYTSSYDTEILETITNYYNNKNTYKDVVSTFLIEKEESTTGAAITITVLLSVVAGIGFLIYMAKEENTVQEEKKAETMKETPIKEEIKKIEKETIKTSKIQKPKTQDLPKLKEDTKEKTKNLKGKTNTSKSLPKKKEEIKAVTKTATKKTTEKNTEKKFPNKTETKKATTSTKKTSSTKTTNKSNSTKKNKATTN